jgi:hypothetical protein
VNADLIRIVHTTASMIRVDREPQKSISTPVVSPDGVAIFVFLSEESVFKAVSAILFLPSNFLSVHKTESD